MYVDTSFWHVIIIMLCILVIAKIHACCGVKNGYWIELDCTVIKLSNSKAAIKFRLEKLWSWNNIQLLLINSNCTKYFWQTYLNYLSTLLYVKLKMKFSTHFIIFVQFWFMAMDGEPFIWSRIVLRTNNLQKNIMLVDYWYFYKIVKLFIYVYLICLYSM